MSLRVLARRLSVLARYDASIAAGRLKADPVQRAAAAELARLHEQVNVYASTLGRYERELRDWKAVRRRHEDRRRQLEAEAAAAEARRPALVKWAAAAMQRVRATRFHGATSICRMPDMMICPAYVQTIVEAWPAASRPSAQM